MRDLIVIAVKTLDPVSFVIAFIVVLFGRKKSIILISAVIAALATETILTTLQLSRPWGLGLIPGFIAALIQAGLSYWIVGLFRKKKAVASPSSPEQEN